MQVSLGFGFDLDRRLVGFDLEKNIALADKIPFGFEPGGNAAFLHILIQTRHGHFVGHRGLSVGGNAKYE